MLSTATILGITNWCFIYIAILIHVMIIFILIKFRRELRDVSILLTRNTCLSALLLCIAAFVMISSNLFSGFLLHNIKFCYAWGLFYDIFECSIYYSYCLQAFFRLCRVIFYKKKFLLSYSLYTILIIGQWILVLALLLPPVFLNWYARLPTENYCLIPYTYIGPEIYHILLLYLIPLICLGIIYIWITRYMHNISQARSLAIAATQRIRNQRDLTVIKRILMLISILIGLRFPTVIFMIQGAITQSLYPLAYAIVGLITSICLILIGIITIHITSQLRKQFLNIFFHQNNQVQTETVPLNQRNTPVAMIANFNNNQRSK
jgi:hypothetical protein